MKVVLDTNILISAIFWRGNPYKVVRGGIKRDYVLCLSKPILAELKEKLTEKFDLPSEQIDEQINILIEYSEIVEINVEINAVKNDQDDNMILECAVSCNADYIISGDRHLLKMREYKGIKIISPAEFLEIIA